LEKLKQQLQIDKMILLGFSFGGELALEYALAYPDSVEKIIVQAPSCGDWMRIASVQLVGLCKIVEEGMRNKIERLIDEESSMFEAWRKVWEMITPEIVDRFSFYRLESAELCKRYWTESKMGFNESMARIIQSNKRSNLLHRLTNIWVPSLVLVGLHDRNTGLEISRDVYVSLQNSVLEIFEESAHFPEIEEPNKFAEVVRRFILNS
jgi:proline iminopeptidase